MPGAHAYSFSCLKRSAIPVLIAVPHAGRTYPRHVLTSMRNPRKAALKLEDRYVDLLARAVAKATGAALLIAHAPRAMIDLNRSPEDVDWEMFAIAERPEVGSYTPTRRARSGLGLIPRRLPGIGELWKRRHERMDLADRVSEIHEPYHACLADSLAALRDRWGVAVLLDVHSMPPIKPLTGMAGAELVVGDRFGAACHGSLIAGAFSYFNRSNRLAAHNRPYAGGYVLERHAAPEEGVHAMQLEIDRRSYLDSQLDEPGPGFAGTVDLLVGLVRRLAVDASDLQYLGSSASPSAQAAE